MEKKKVLGFMSLFYGKEYLRESLLSIRDHVDMMHIAHTRNPSHGNHTSQPCPDSKDELKAIAFEVLGDKLIWESADRYPNEAVHRDRRYVHSRGYDCILTIDADEIFNEKMLPATIDFICNNKEKFYGIKGYKNMWRSFNHCCVDSFRPIRGENLHAQNNFQNHECELEIWHFSTAQNSEMIKYKNSIFGHASEIRPNWFEEIYLNWKEGNKWLHPVSLQIWEEAAPYDKTLMPEYLKQHKNYSLDVIK